MVSDCHNPQENHHLFPFLSQPRAVAATRPRKGPLSQECLLNWNIKPWRYSDFHTRSYPPRAFLTCWMENCKHLLFLGGYRQSKLITFNKQ